MEKRSFFWSSRRAVALGVASFFFVTSLPAGPTSFSTEMAQAAALNLVESFTLPADMGSVTQTYAAPGASAGKPTILVQDAHINFDAQISEAKIFEYLTVGSSYRTILLEGLFDSLDTRALKLYPDENAKLEMSRRLLKRGDLKGAEYFDISANTSSALFRGLEESGPYYDNLRAFLSVHNKKNPAFVSQIGEFLSAFKNLKNQAFSEELLDFSKVRSRYHREAMELLDYLTYLKSKSDGWKNFSELEVLFESASASPRESAAAKLRSLDANKLFRELEIWEGEIAQFLARDGREKKIWELAVQFELLEKALNFELSRLDKEDFTRAVPSLRAKVLAARLSELGAAPVEVSPYAPWDDILEGILDFYRAAEAREEVFKQRIMEQPESVVLIGGYHTAGLTDFLRQHEMPFIVLAPKMNRIDSAQDSKIYLQKLLTMRPPDTFIPEWLFRSDLPLADKENRALNIYQSCGVPKAEAEQIAKNIFTSVISGQSLGAKEEKFVPVIFSGTPLERPAAVAERATASRGPQGIGQKLYRAAIFSFGLIPAAAKTFWRTSLTRKFLLIFGITVFISLTVKDSLLAYGTHIYVQYQFSTAMADAEKREARHERIRSEYPQLVSFNSQNSKNIAAGVLTLRRLLAPGTQTVIKDRDAERFYSFVSDWQLGSDEDFESVFKNYDIHLAAFRAAPGREALVMVQRNRVFLITALADGSVEIARIQKTDPLLLGAPRVFERAQDLLLPYEFNALEKVPDVEVVYSAIEKVIWRLAALPSEQSARPKISEAALTAILGIDWENPAVLIEHVLAIFPDGKVWIRFKKEGAVSTEEYLLDPNQTDWTKILIPKAGTRLENIAAPEAKAKMSASQLIKNGSIRARVKYLMGVRSKLAQSFQVVSAEKIKGLEAMPVIAAQESELKPAPSVRETPIVKPASRPPRAAPVEVVKPQIKAPESAVPVEVVKPQIKAPESVTPTKIEAPTTALAVRTVEVPAPKLSVEPKTAAPAIQPPEIPAVQTLATPEAKKVPAPILEPPALTSVQMVETAAAGAKAAEMVPNLLGGLKQVYADAKTVPADVKPIFDLLLEDQWLERGAYDDYKKNVLAAGENFLILQKDGFFYEVWSGGIRRLSYADLGKTPLVQLPRRAVEGSLKRDGFTKVEPILYGPTLSPEQETGTRIIRLAINGPFMRNYIDLNAKSIKFMDGWPSKTQKEQMADVTVEGERLLAQDPFCDIYRTEGRELYEGMIASDKVQKKPYWIKIERKTKDGKTVWEDKEAALPEIPSYDVVSYFMYKGKTDEKTGKQKGVFQKLAYVNLENLRVVARLGLRDVVLSAVGNDLSWGDVRISDLPEGSFELEKQDTAASYRIRDLEEKKAEGAQQKEDRRAGKVKGRSLGKITARGAFEQVTERLYQFLAPREALPETADLILLLGSSDLNPPREAAQLWKAYAEKGILIPIAASGGVGRLTGEFKKPEAQVYRDELVRQGVPEDKILVEDKSTNTGQNVAFTRNILREKGIEPQTIIVVQTPALQKRAWATVAKEFGSSAKVINQAPPLPDFKAMSDNELMQALELARGEMKRLADYGPEGKNFIVQVADQNDPAWQTAAVLNSWAELLVEEASASSLGTATPQEELAAILSRHEQRLGAVVLLKNEVELLASSDALAGLLELNEKNILVLYLPAEVAKKIPANLGRFANKNLIVRTAETGKLADVLAETRRTAGEMALVGGAGELFSNQAVAFDGLKLVTDRVMKKSTLRPNEKSAGSIGYLTALAFGLLAQGQALGFDSGLVEAEGKVYYLDYSFVMSEMMERWMNEFQAEIAISKAA